MNKIRKKLARFRLFLSISKPLLLSHHPICDKYDDHIYHIGKHKYCIGCFTFYPVMVITLIISLFVFDLNNPVNAILLYFYSFLFMTPVLLSLMKLTKYKIIKILSKASIGIGVGFYIAAVIFLPIFLILKIIMIFQVNTFTGVIAYIRGKHIVKECGACEFKGDWSTCPSMQPIIHGLKEYNFIKQKDIDKMKSKREESIITIS